ncbi:MAG: Gfo/Idh/MocA family oxidoreductase [Verrucomicrobia bacterium]|nr:Gfo/Idh/MocA family oxidoreductase [Verrucomicrobiota bacterium]
MTSNNSFRLGVIGTGHIAARYAHSWVSMPEVSYVAVSDVNAASRRNFIDICRTAGRPEPREFDDFRSMLAVCRDELDAVYVSTPHALHAEHGIAVVESGLDLLIEKPMVTTVAEAERLILARDQSRSTIVIAFQGALSPLIADTRKRAQAGEFGELVSVAGTIWENWSSRYEGHWKQQMDLSGGGFMFDTGAHMINTVCLLADADCERVSAFMNNRQRNVDVVCAVAGRLATGALLTLNAAGEGPPGCSSQITFFYTQATVRLDAWGSWREIAVAGAPGLRQEVEITNNPLKSFLAIRAGNTENLSTAETGLRFARLWDAIRASAAKDGEPVAVSRGATTAR